MAPFSCFFKASSNIIRLFCMHAQLGLILCYPLDCRCPGSSVHGIIPGRMLEWVAISSSRGSSGPRDWTCVSCSSCIGRWILYHWATWAVAVFYPWIMSNSLQPHGLQHARVPRPSLSPRVCSISCPLSQWCHPTVSSSCPRLLPSAPGKPHHISMHHRIAFLELRFLINLTLPK